MSYLGLGADDIATASQLESQAQGLQIQAAALPADQQPGMLSMAEAMRGQATVIRAQAGQSPDYVRGAQESATPIFGSSSSSSSSVFDTIGAGITSFATGLTKGIAATKPPAPTQYNVTRQDSGRQGSGLPSWLLPVGIAGAVLIGLATVFSATRSNPRPRPMRVLRKIVFGGSRRRNGSRGSRYRVPGLAGVFAG